MLAAYNHMPDFYAISDGQYMHALASGNIQMTAKATPENTATSSMYVITAKEINGVAVTKLSTLCGAH